MYLPQLKKKKKKKKKKKDYLDANGTQTNNGSGR